MRLSASGAAIELGPMADEPTRAFTGWRVASIPRPADNAEPYHRASTMRDHLSPRARSDHMRRIRKTGTKPEMRVRQAAHRLGYRFRLHRSDLPGTPDLVFPRLGKVVLVHGCFWHQHPRCRLARKPKSRLDYWLPKLERNRQRDLQATAALRAVGWRVLVIWECQVPDARSAVRLLKPFLGMER